MSDATSGAQAPSPPQISSRIRTKLLEAFQLNRVTVVVGPTGCGKSTLIPSLLLNGLSRCICCTQPRRLAVVAIAKRVAELEGAGLGGDKIGETKTNPTRERLFCLRQQVYYWKTYELMVWKR